MSKLGNIRASDIERVLGKLSYAFHHQRGSHRFYVKGAKIIGVPAHKGKTLGKGYRHYGRRVFQPALIKRRSYE